MKFAVISDTHFGDPDCTLFVGDGKNKPVPGANYAQFLKAVGKKSDYLVLLGDILDFAISSYEEAYTIAREFFLRVQKDNVADQMIYIPGNHDEDIWHTVEHEVNIMDRIKSGDIPQKFKMSLAGVIDDRSSSKRARLMLPGVDERRSGGKIGYGGLFLDGITGKGAKQTRFNFVYPNLYVASDSGSVLITHGHYFESYWSLLSEWAPDLFGGQLKITIPMTLQEMISINFPTNQLSCSGFGQAGPLTDVIRGIEIDVRNHDLDSVSGYLDNLFGKLATILGISGIGKLAWNASMGWVKGRIVKALGTMQDARYDKGFMDDSDVKDRFRRFYQRSCAEIASLRETDNIDIPMPSVVIFGHTHQPFAWDSTDMSIPVPGGNTVRLFNTGGWLSKKTDGDKPEFCGAEVFKYETGSGFSSVSIR